MKLEEIIEGFSAKFKLDGLSADDEGVYRLNADDMDIAIADADDGEHFVLWAELGPEPLLCQGRFCRVLPAGDVHGAADEGRELLDP